MSSGQPRTLEDLAETLALLEERVARLEQGQPIPFTVAPEVAAPPAASATSSQVDLTLVGRSILVIGGAYLLRAATELEAVPDALGASLGFVYALALLALADRAAGRRRGFDAALHGLTALLVAYPLIAELVVRFHFLSAWGAAAATALVCAAGVAIAARRRAVGLAWIVVTGTLVAALGMGFVTLALAPQLAVLVALTGAAGWLGTRLDQPPLVWPPALLGEILLGAAVLVVLIGQRELHDAAALALLGPLPFLLLAVPAMARSAAETTDTPVADRVLVLITLVVGVAGGAAVAMATGWGVVYGVAGLAVAALGSLAALRMQNIPFWTSTWLLVALASLVALGGVPSAALAASCAVLGVVLIVLGRRAHEAAQLQGLVLLAVAAVGSGLLAAALRGMIGPPAAAFPAPVALLALVALLVALPFVAPDDGSRLVWMTRLVALILAYVHVVGVVAAAVIVAAAPSRPAAAAIRTVVLALSAIAVAAMSRSPRARQAVALILPVLVLAIAKLLLEDLAVGTAATQTVGLAAVGAAVIVAHKLRPRSRPDA